MRYINLHFAYLLTDQFDLVWT